MVLKLQHASEALEKFIKTQLAEHHPLEFLMYRSSIEPTICIFNNPSISCGADAASQETIL